MAVEVTPPITKVRKSRMTILGLLVAALFLSGCQKFQSSLIGKSAAEELGSTDTLGPGKKKPKSKASPTPAPTATPAPNAKLFFKSPTFANKRSVNLSSSFDFLLTGFFISGITGGKLENSDIVVYADMAKRKVRATASADGKWNFPSTGDTNFKLTQAMGFYWINEQRNKAERTLTGAWAVKGQRIHVYSKCEHPQAAQNAFWDGENQLVCIGSNGGNQHLAYDASVYAHEMGHANIDFQTSQFSFGTNSQQTRCGNFFCCTSELGCASAIDEGQADVHAFMLFESGNLGEFYFNSMAGFPERSGQVNSDRALLSSTRFKQSSEGHAMGGVWNAIWWSLRKSVGAEVADPLFYAHLRALTGTDNFKTALSKILVTDQALVTAKKFSVAHRQQIIAAFSRHGINL